MFNKWKLITESISDNVYEISGALVLNDKAKLSDILDKIRALPGVTRVQSDKSLSNTGTLSNRNRIHFKFRPSNSIKSTIISLKREIIHIDGVSGFHIIKTRRHS